MTVRGTQARAKVTAWRDRVAAVTVRAVRPLTIVTARGWIVLAVGIGAIALTLVFDWGEMAAIAGVVVVVLLAAVVFVLGRTKYDARVELASPRVVVGEQAVGRVVVRNTAKAASPSNLIELPVGRGRAEFRVPRLGPGQEHDDLFTIPTQRRAILTLGPVTSVRTDPLGLLRRAVRWTEPTELFVHPRVIALSSDTTGILRDLEGLPTRDLADDDVSFHALREYSPGDDLRHVHWKSTARTGQVMIRQFEQTRRSHLVIALATGGADYRTDDEFELAVSMAGSIGISALRDGKAVTLLTARGPLRAGTATRLLDLLSGIERDDSAGIDTVARTVGREVPGASVVVLVTGQEADATTIRAASRRLPATARALCARAAEGGRLARRVIGDTPIVDVPDLESLRPAMRAATA